MSGVKAGINFQNRFSYQKGFIGAFPTVQFASLLPQPSGTTAWDTTLGQMFVINNAGAWTPLVPPIPAYVDVNLTGPIGAPGYAPNNNELIFADCTLGAINIDLTAGAATYRDTKFYIKKIDASGNLVVLNTLVGETVDGQRPYNLGGQYSALTIGTNADGIVVSPQFFIL